ncbi:MAG TPA: hypothetical protein PK880_15775 [Candidatus Competibacter sp.]|nr:hypothetical protein [Candidatus Competibacter sp.]
MGLSDGGITFTASNKYCSGKVIPNHWRDEKWAVDFGDPFTAATFGGPSPMHGNVCVPP